MVLPLFYLLLSLLSGLLGVLVVSLRRRSQTKDGIKDVAGNLRILSHPVRLLFIALSSTEFSPRSPFLYWHGKSGVPWRFFW